MASFKIEWKRSAEHDLRRIDPGRIGAILSVIARMEVDPLPRGAIRLTGAEGLYRLRVGVFRVIYGVESSRSAVVIYYVRHRREAYRDL